MRSRITITISEDLLDKVDQSIDGKHIRNRSQAIESLLHQTLTPTIETAVLLAGGELSLHPQTGKPVPKSLLPIKDKALIDHTLEHLKRHQFRKVIICLGDKGDLIQEYCGNGKRYGLELVYSGEEKKLGTGGALKKVRRMIGKKAFLLIHGDILTNINLSDFAKFYVNEEKLACIAIKPRYGRKTYGQIYIEGNKVIDFKHPEKADAISLVNTGIYIFDNHTLSLLPNEEVFKLEDTLIPELIKRNEISGYTFQGIWYDISSPEDYQEANDRWE